MKRKDAMKSCRFPFLVVFIAVCSIGCQPSRPSLIGVVTFDGKPLDNGTLQLIPDDKNTEKMPTGARISEGKYSIPSEPGIPEGIYTVRISSPEPVLLPPGFSINAPNALPPKLAAPADRIPAEWNTTSTHTIEIKKGRNQHNFAVTSE
ncbi:MAG: hypothetical protein FWH27_13745 [Planctomycetaceae bacterium]|nr:hypothetical protein [Planctomycetaceae bacterium]